MKLITAKVCDKKASPGYYFNVMFITGNQRRSSGNTESMCVEEMEYLTPVSYTHLDVYKILDRSRASLVPLVASGSSNLGTGRPLASSSSLIHFRSARSAVFRIACRAISSSRVYGLCGPPITYAVRRVGQDCTSRWSPSRVAAMDRARCV